MAIKSPAVAQESAESLWEDARFQRKAATVSQAIRKHSGVDA